MATKKNINALLDFMNETQNTEKPKTVSEISTSQTSKESLTEKKTGQYKLKKEKKLPVTIWLEPEQKMLWENFFTNQQMTVAAGVRLAVTHLMDDVANGTPIKL